jgi:hypothetical protein
MQPGGWKPVEGENNLNATYCMSNMKMGQQCPLFDKGSLERWQVIVVQRGWTVRNSPGYLKEYQLMERRIP